MKAGHPREAELSADVLRQRVSYDPVTGVLIWKTARRRQDVGRHAGAVSDVHGYRSVRIAGKLWYAHRLIWLYVHDRWPAAEIDHINGNRADNRLANLREATHSQNNANRRPTKSSRTLKGTRYRRDRQRWLATINVGGRSIHIGCFLTAEEAHAAYIAKAREIHGEFAWGV